MYDVELIGILLSARESADVEGKVHATSVSCANKLFAVDNSKNILKKIVKIFLIIEQIFNCLSICIYIHLAKVKNKKNSPNAF